MYTYIYIYVYTTYNYIYANTHTYIYTVIHETHRARAYMPMIINSDEGRVYEHIYKSIMFTYMLFYGLKTQGAMYLSNTRCTVVVCATEITIFFPPLTTACLEFYDFFIGHRLKLQTGKFTTTLYCIRILQPSSRVCNCIFIYCYHRLRMHFIQYFVVRQG